MSTNSNTALLLTSISPQSVTRNNTDVSLIHRIQQHDTEALSELYDFYSTNIYSIALFVTRKTLLAEEATQETFIKLWTGAEKYHASYGFFDEWFFVITRHCAVNILHREFRKMYHPGSSMQLQAT